MEETTKKLYALVHKYEFLDGDGDVDYDEDIVAYLLLDDDAVKRQERIFNAHWPIQYMDYGGALRCYKFELRELNVINGTACESQITALDKMHWVNSEIIKHIDTVRPVKWNPDRYGCEES